MREQIIKAGLIGGLIVFVVGMLIWKAFPCYQMHFNKFSNESSVRDVIQNNASESGLYTIVEPEGKQNGLYLFAAVLKEGRTSTLLSASVVTFILDVVLGFIVAWIFTLTKLNVRRSIYLAAVIGFAFGAVTKVPMVIWTGFPVPFALSTIIQSIISWSIAGYAMAKLLRK